MLLLSHYAAHLKLDADGIWSAQNVSRVSYPAEGNACCLAVEDVSFWFQHRNNCILEIIKRHPPDAPFFDIGGGNGYVARELQNAGLEVVMVEPGEIGARSARNRGVMHVVHASLEDAGFFPELIPSMGLFDVLEHIQDDAGFLCRVRNLLRPGGRVYLTVPAGNWLWSQEDVIAGHFRRYTPGTLMRTLESAGFQAIFTTCIFGFLPFPILICRSLPFRLGRQRASLSPDAMRRDHKARSVSGGRFLDFMMRRELSRLKAGRRLSFGASCLAVARKV